MAFTISLCMIVKNEEDVLARCLDSAAPAADEIIIADTGSDDNTIEIAKKYTDKIYNFKWCDDFAAARNFAFSKATMQYCMWLDADDVITKENLKRLIKIKNDLNPSADIIMLPYYLTLNPDGTPGFWFYRERIIRNSAVFKWEGEVHEVIAPSGKIIYENAAVIHKKTHPSDSDRNLRILEKAKNGPNGLSARQRFYYGRELYEHNRLQEAAKVLKEFISSRDGWTENKIEACRILSLCAEKTDDRNGAYAALFDSFRFDFPRAETCCQLGSLFLGDNQYSIAAYWYKAALSIPYRPDNGGFVNSDCYGYLPCIQLCVCYDRIGDFKRASEYNDKAGEYKPNSPEVSFNRAYFKNKL